MAQNRIANRPAGNTTCGVITMESKNSPQAKAEKVIEVAKTLREQNHGEIQSDVLGSYTGMTEEGSRPVQDADDL